MTNLSGTDLNNGAAVGPKGEGRDSPSRFPKYPAYKDSGVEWLGDVPEHWYSARFSRVVMAIKDGTHGTFERVDEGVPLLSAKNVQNGFLDINEGESLISEDDSRSIVSNGFPSAGDLLLTIVGTIGRSCVYTADKPYAFQRSVCFLRFYKRYSSYFFYYFSQSKFFQEQLAGRSKSSAQAGVYMGDVVATSVVFPPDFSEQTQIARFLDHETARIDALIEEQQRLIELLKEKRQAVISHAVTKGLDPTVPIKDSGVEWLGEVPAHWEVCALMNLTAPGRAIMYGIVLPGENVEDGIPIVKGGDVKPSRLVLDLLCRTTREIEASFARARLKPKDVVYSIRGTIGDAELVPDDFAHVNITQDVARISPREDIDSGWLLYVMRSKPVFVQLEQRSLGAAVRGINICDLKRAKIPVPPALERVRIAEFIRLEVSRLDELMLEASGGIGLLQERRSALISAAVTGKIDVRGWQPPASIQAPEFEVAEAD